MIIFILLIGCFIPLWCVLSIEDGIHSNASKPDFGPFASFQDYPERIL
jgi:hypothetical protein